jgi:hypothetical protein
MATGLEEELDREERMRMSSEEYLGESSEAAEESEGEISVGCPSPVPRGDSEESEDRPEDDYFKPLKKLKMMQIDKVSYSIAGKAAAKRRARRREPREPPGGVKSFSILDILNHRPSREPQGARIVRPWDTAESSAGGPPPAHRGLLPPPPLLYRIPDYETCSSGRSSTGGSDCCTSPDIVNCTSLSSPTRSTHRPQHRKPAHPSGKPNASPLDALFQMTSKTFEELNGDPSQGECLYHISFFQVIYLLPSDNTT